MVDFTPIRVGLSAVILAVQDGHPKVLTLPARNGEPAALPFGPFEPQNHRTFELGLRGWVLQQTGFEPRYVEQLYTFGDRGRELPEASLEGASEDTRVVSVGYVALASDAAAVGAGFDAVWSDWYGHFPWEDHRTGRPEIIDGEIVPSLKSWAGSDPARGDRIANAFGRDWAEDRALDRYELLYEAALVTEALRISALTLPQPTAATGKPLRSDHRRILATAISRIRGKLRYRPIIFDLMPRRFTLSDLQRTAEALLGLPLHKQNFRRAIDKAGLVIGTGELSADTGGRPAELFRFAEDAPGARARLGIPTPVLRGD